MTGNTAADVVGAIRISELYQALTGAKPRSTGACKYRARAVWRDGNGLNVSLDDSRGTWFDFRDGCGGGVLDLVQHVRGGSRQEALRWVADFAGIALSDDTFSPAERAEWAQKRRELEKEQPDARYWKRAAINMSEELLTGLKAGLVDPALPQPDTFEIYHVENMLSRLRRIDGAELVADFRSWRDQYPGITAALVRAAKDRERTERQVLLAYLKPTNPERHAA